MSLTHCLLFEVTENYKTFFIMPYDDLMEFLFKSFFYQKKKKEKIKTTKEQLISHVNNIGYVFELNI